MTPRAARLCGHPECVALVYGTDRRCAEHRREGRWPTKTGTNRTVTNEHKQRRLRVLARDPLCQLRYEGVCTGISTVCDHIVPLAAGGADTDDGCQGVCEPCGNVKTSREAHFLAGHDVPCPWPTEGSPKSTPPQRPRQEGTALQRYINRVEGDRPALPRTIWTVR